MKKENLNLYRVQKGDTLTSIAAKYNMSPTEILVRNKILPKQIKEGFILDLKR